MSVFTKDSGAILDYAFDWSAWLNSGASETISDFTLAVETGITLESSPAASESDGVVTFWLSGGTPGVSYGVACEIETSEGRTDERTMVVKVTDR